MALISKLNIENGSLIDTVSGLQATIVGSKLHFEQTQQGYMLLNDGTDGNYVDIPNSSTMTNTGDWSVTIGFKFRKPKNVGGIITKMTENTNGWGIYVYKTDLRIAIPNSYYMYPLKQDQLYFCTITYTLNNFKVYVNGKLKHTVNATYTPNTHLITLSRYIPYSATFSLTGKIGTPSIYNHALSQEEINQLYKEWLQPKPTLNLQREAITTLPIEYKEEGLVAAYSGNLVNNKWLDKSGNERHGTVVGNFVNVENGLQSNQKGYISYNSSGLYQGIVTVVGRLKSNIYLSPLINNKNGGGVGTSDAWGINIFPAYITYDINGTINGRQIIQLSSGANRLSKFTDIAIEMNFNNLTVKAFINGVLTDSKTFLQPSLTNQTVGYIMSVVNYNSALGFNGTVKELLIYNRALSQQEITAYHAKWIKPTLVEKWNYGADGVVKTIPNWIKKSGSFKIKEFVKQNGELAPLPSITAGTNYLECVTAGTIALPNNWAYGTTIFDIFKAVDGNQPRVGIISSKISTINGWSIFITNPSSNNSVRLQKLNTTTNLTTINGYINTGTWYSIKITRTTLGKFTMYIRGGNFGNEFVLASASNNPITDNTYTTSNYTVLTMWAGDKIGEIKQYNEVI